MVRFFKNLFIQSRRNLLITLISLAGLSSAFAAFILIGIQSSYDLRFDNFHADGDRIFYVTAQYEEETPWGIVSRPFIDQFDSLQIPLVEDRCALLKPFHDSKSYLIYKEGESEKGIKETLTLTYPNLISFFNMEIVEGDPNVLSHPNHVMVPASFSERLGIKGSVVGLELRIGGSQMLPDSSRTLVVGAVYNDFPDHSILENTIYRSVGSLMENSYGSNFPAFVKLRSRSAKAEVEALINKKPNMVDNHQKVALHPIREAYFLDGITAENIRKGNKTYSYLLLSLGVLILVIALINYLNFTLADAPSRIRGINTRKILGASSRSLRNGLVLESIFFITFAFAIALILIVFFRRTPMAQLFSANLDFSAQWGVLAITFGIALVTAVLAALWPAFYMTSFSPALTLKGNFAQSRAGMRVRNTLIVIQFAYSFFLIAGAVMIHLQQEYLRTFDSGFDRSMIAECELSDIILKDPQSFLNRFNGYPEIEEVSLAHQPIWNVLWTESVEWQGNQYTMNVNLVTPGFIRALGLQLQEGKEPANNLSAETNYSRCLINETAARQIGLRPGDRFFSNAVVEGVVSDYHYNTLAKPVQPLILIYPNENQGLKYAYFRILTPDALKIIRKEILSVDPTFPLNLRMMDDTFGEEYGQVVQTGQMFTLLSLLAIIIALMGQFGIVMFDLQRRTREIALRKVMGATEGEVILLFNRKYVLLLSVGFCISIIPALWVIRNWLSDFEYHIPLYWWVFPLILFATVAITGVVVTLQSRKVARSNPVSALKTD